MLVGILSQDIDKVWLTVVPIVKRAIDKSQHDYTIENVYDAIKNRDMQLWVWYGEDKIEACLVSAIATFPNRRVCQLLFIAGIGLRDWLSSESIITEWARANGCSQLEGYARDGWLRVLKSWRKVWTTIRRDI